ncbi:MAG: hypothetical protein RL441_1103 [Actinomycetota bacterium]
MSEAIAATALPKPKLRGVLHAISAPLTFIAGIPLLLAASETSTRIAIAVYIFTALNLFGVSATYHIGRWSVGVKTMLRRLDHSNIFLIIAGTYTPLSVMLLPADESRVLLTAIWIAAALGVGISTLWPHAPRWVSVPLYLIMGWVSVFYVPDMAELGGAIVVWLVALGGLLYSVGAIVYATKRPNLSITWFGFHELFHAFTVAAFAVQFAAIAIAVS